MPLISVIYRYCKNPNYTKRIWPQRPS